MKDKIFSKLNMKNYTNELEKIFEKKQYSENVKNVLLTILYKIEKNYPQYIKLKENSIGKEAYINNYFNIIQNKCNEIKIIENIDDDIKKLYKNVKIDSKNKIIETYLIDKIMLYSLALVDYKKIKLTGKNKYLKNAFNEFIKYAYAESTIEILRDFSVWSWDVNKKEILEYMFNLLTHNIEILITQEKFYEILMNVEENDFLLEIEKELRKRYSLEEYTTFYENLKIFIIQNYYLENTKELEEIKEHIEEYQNQENDEINEIKNKIEELKQEYLNIEQRILKYEEILKSKELLKKEFIKYNKKLEKSNKEKIESTKFIERLKKYRTKYKIELKNNKEMQEQQEDLINKIIAKRENEKEYIYKLKIENNEILLKLFTKIQIDFIKIFESQIINSESNKKIFSIIKKIRTYNFIYANENSNNNEIKIELEKLKNQIIKKSVDNKVLIQITNDEKLNLEILKTIFELKSLKIESVSIHISQNKEGNLKVNYYDDETLEKTIIYENVEFEDILIKYNKNTKVFLNIK